MLKILDKILLSLIAWLYLKHTRIYLHLLTQEARSLPPYEPPIPEQVAYALKQFNTSVEELSSTSALHNSRNIDKVRTA